MRGQVFKRTEGREPKGLSEPSGTRQPSARPGGGWGCMWQERETWCDDDAQASSGAVRRLR